MKKQFRGFIGLIIAFLLVSVTFAADDIYLNTKNRIKTVDNNDGTYSLSTSPGGDSVTIPKLYDSGIVSLFNRLRVVQSQKLFDNQLQYNGQPVFWDEKLTGTASSTHDANNSAQDLSVTADGDEVIRQLKEYQRYQSGNAQVVKMTYTPDENSNDIAFVLRSSSGAFDGCTAGVPCDIVFNRDDWNHDKLDGTGISGITLDLTKSQILFIDLEWLSVGTVRYGFEIDGKFVLAHSENNANKIRGAYMTTANLPARHYITRSGTDIIQEIGYNDAKNGVFVRYTASGQTSGTLKQICTAIESEGGQEEEAGYPFSGAAGATSVTLTSGSTFISVAQHQLLFNGIENRVKYIPQLAIVSSTDEPVLVEYIYNPSSVTGGTFNPVTGGVYNSAMERNVTATSLTGGNVIFQTTVLASSGGLFTPAVSDSKTTTLVSKLPFGIGIDGDTPTPFAVRVTNTGTGSTDIYYHFEWKEIR